MKDEMELRNMKIMDYLLHCCDQEYKKPLDEIDMDFITECIDFWIELYGGIEPLTQEEIKERVKQISSTTP